MAACAVLAEYHVDGALLGAAQDGQLEGAAGRRRAQRAEQVVDGADGLARGRDDQVAAGQAGLGGRAVLGDLADEQAVGVRQADRAAQPPGHVAGSDGDAELRRLDGLPAGQRVDPASQRLVGGNGQVEALTQAVRVDPEQLSRGVQDRAARGARQQRSRVLEAAGDAHAARAAEGTVDARDEPERHPQPAAARVGQPEDRRPDRGRLGGPRHGPEPDRSRPR